MPCYDGETLRRRIERGPLPVDAALDIATQIAAGLAKAHRNGIVHRDIKPPNVIVTADGVVKILDFGLAKLVGSAAISAAGSSLGTPAYMSPEQARGDEVDPRTDLWSLGIVCYEMLAGQRPFRGERAQAVIYAILNERPQPLREIRPETPPEVARIVERLLAKPRAARYATVEEALADLRALRGEGATGITRTLAAPPARRMSRGRRAWLWGAAAALLSAAGLGLYLLPRAGRGAAPVQATFIRLTDAGPARPSPPCRRTAAPSSTSRRPAPAGSTSTASGWARGAPSTSRPASPAAPPSRPGRPTAPPSPSAPSWGAAASI